MSFFDGFCSELEKLAAPAPAPAWGKKKTFVPGMTQKQVQKSEAANRAPAPKVQRMTFKAPKPKVPAAGSLKGKKAFAPKKAPKSNVPGLDSLLKGIN